MSSGVTYEFGKIEIIQGCIQTGRWRQIDGVKHIALVLEHMYTNRNIHTEPAADGGALTLSSLVRASQLSLQKSW